MRPFVTVMFQSVAMFDLFYGNSLRILELIK
ncbi:hypothetical protein GGR95_001282 [Sulfitobacter undariae]|uniref:Uncharacterized protein n=1 Tax=Sulfitobacter undariae TaxID=1563671 RepID=A0A7W6E2M6_9RHOB|nr:hypothetical protein [Sulfitobacter undariae]